MPCARSLKNPVINMKIFPTIDFTVSFAADVLQSPNSSLFGNKESEELLSY